MRTSSPEEEEVKAGRLPEAHQWHPLGSVADLDKEGRRSFKSRPVGGRRRMRRMGLLVAP